MVPKKSHISKMPSEQAAAAANTVGTQPTADKAAASSIKPVSNSRKRTASDLDDLDRYTSNKKPKESWDYFKRLVYSPPPEEKDKASFSKDMLETFKEIRFKLSDHIPRSMAAIFEGIEYKGTIPRDAPVSKQVEILMDELKRRVLSGKFILDDEVRVINRVDKKHSAGAYDEWDSDGILVGSDVRLRLDDAKFMVARLPSSYLQDIMRELRPSSNCVKSETAELALKINKVLLRLAQKEKNIKREYMIVKKSYLKCHGVPSNTALNYNSNDLIFSD